MTFTIDVPQVKCPRDGTPCVAVGTSANGCFRCPNCGQMWTADGTSSTNPPTGTMAPNQGSADSDFGDEKKFGPYTPPRVAGRNVHEKH